MVHMHACIFISHLFFTFFTYIGFSYYLNCDLFGLKQNKCWYKCGRDLNFQYLHRTQTNYENIYYKWWDIGRRGKNSASLNCCLWYFSSWFIYFLEMIFPFSRLQHIKVLLPPFVWFISTILFGLFINVINVWLQINYSPWIVVYFTCLDTTYRKLDDESYKWTQISFDMLILIEKSRSIFTHVNVSVGCHNNGEFVLYVVSFNELWQSFTLSCTHVTNFQITKAYLSISKTRILNELFAHLLRLFANIKVWMFKVGLKWKLLH